MITQRNSLPKETLKPKSYKSKSMIFLNKRNYLEYYSTAVKLTSKIINKVFTYSLLTPIDLPIDARNIMQTNNIKKGVKRIDPVIDTTVSKRAILGVC